MAGLLIENELPVTCRVPGPGHRSTEACSSHCLARAERGESCTLTTLHSGKISHLTQTFPKRYLRCPSTAQYSQVQPSTAQYSQVQPNTIQYSPEQPNTIQCSPEQPTTAHYSQVQPNTAQYSPSSLLTLSNLLPYLSFQKPHSLLCLVTTTFTLGGGHTQRDCKKRPHILS